jgi:peptide chain release factor 2
MNDIPGTDLVVEAWPPRPTGGQHVGGGPSGVKIVHTPSGLTAICDTDRSAHRNRNIAMDMILGGLTSAHFRGGR